MSGRESVHSVECGARRVTDLSPGSGMHFTDPLPRKWPDNAGRRVRCACHHADMCMAHAAQRDAEQGVIDLTTPCTVCGGTGGGTWRGCSHADCAYCSGTGRIARWRTVPTVQRGQQAPS